MTTTKTAKTVGEERLEKISIKAQKERDAEDAMRAYRAEQAAVLERTQHLRALRLAREGKFAAAAARTPVESAATSAKRETSTTVKSEPVRKSKKAAPARAARGR